MFSASQKLSYMAPTKTGSKNLLCRLLYLLHKHIPHPSAFTYYMRGIDDLRLRLRTDFPPSLVMHGEKRPDRHFDLAFSGHISHMSVPVRNTNTKIVHETINDASTVIYPPAFLFITIRQPPFPASKRAQKAPLCP